MGIENKRYELADYEELAAKNHRGLVPMEFQENALPWQKGEVAGIKPAEAKKLHDDGTAIPVDVDQLKGGKSPERVERDDTEAKRLDAIEISPDIMSGHHLPRIQLARTIAGREVPNDTAAREIIQAELARRDGGAVSKADLAAASAGQSAA